MVSTAIDEDEPRARARARARVRPCSTGADLLAEVARLRRSIAVSGTHGKTTTASMVAHVLLETGRSPSYLIGGELRSTATNAAWGEGEWIVVEADESDRSFLEIAPEVAVVTNVELDHHATYRSLPALEAAVRRVARRRPSGASSGSALDLDAGPVETFGIEAGDLAAHAVRLDAAGARFAVEGVEVALAVPGAHNVLNALAALAACRAAGVPIAEAAPALRSFAGAGRRFERVGESRAGARGLRRLRPSPDRGQRHARGRAHPGAAARGGVLPAAPVLAHRAPGPRLRPRAGARRPRAGARRLPRARASRRTTPASRAGWWPLRRPTPPAAGPCYWTPTPGRRRPAARVRAPRPATCCSRSARATWTAWPGGWRSAAVSEPEEVVHDYPLARLTTVRTGGPADLFAAVSSTARLEAVLGWVEAQGLEVGVVGSGSNLLVSDEGFRGLVLKLDGGLAEIERDGERILCGGGARLPQAAARAAARWGLAGLEFGVNIPGTVGGAVRMNANAYGGELGAGAGVGRRRLGAGHRAARARDARLRLPALGARAARGGGRGVLRPRARPTRPRSRPRWPTCAPGARRPSPRGSRPSARRSRTRTTRAPRAGAPGACSMPPAAAAWRWGEPDSRRSTRTSWRTRARRAPPTSSRSWPRAAAACASASGSRWSPRSSCSVGSRRRACTG